MLAISSALEATDQRDVHAADETDLAALGGEGRQHADQERALLLLEGDGLHVGQRHHHVDDGEVHVGEFLGDLLEGDGLREADGDDRILATLGKAAMRLLELRLVAGLELGNGDAGFLVEALGALAHAFVEGFVELATRRVDDGGLGDVLRGGGSQGSCGEQRDQQSGPEFHGSSLFR
jgi:hypothetical protein